MSKESNALHSPSIPTLHYILNLYLSVHLSVTTNCETENPVWLLLKLFSVALFGCLKESLPNKIKPTFQTTTTTANKTHQTSAYFLCSSEDTRTRSWITCDIFFRVLKTLRDWGIFLVYVRRRGFTLNFYKSLYKGSYFPRFKYCCLQTSRDRNMRFWDDTYCLILINSL